MREEGIVQRRSSGGVPGRKPEGAPARNSRDAQLRDLVLSGLGWAMLTGGLIGAGLGSNGLSSGGFLIPPFLERVLSLFFFLSQAILGVHIWYTGIVPTGGSSVEPCETRQAPSIWRALIFCKEHGGK